MKYNTVTIEGWYCISKEYPDLKRTVLDDKVFKYSIRTFDIRNLEVTTLERIQGSFLHPTYVTGVIDVKGSLIPFFINRQKVKTLQNLISSVRDRTDFVL